MKQYVVTLEAIEARWHCVVDGHSQADAITTARPILQDRAEAAGLTPDLYATGTGRYEAARVKQIDSGTLL